MCMCKCVCANTHVKTIYVLFMNFFCEKGRVVLVETDFRPPFEKLARSNLVQEIIKRLWQFNSVNLPYVGTHLLPNSISHGVHTNEGTNGPSKG